MTRSTATLGELLAGALPGAEVPPLGPAADVPVSRVTADSRHVTDGAVFVVVRGTREDGARYVLDAVSRGAVAIVAGSEADVATTDVPVVRVGDARGALAVLAASFHGHPSHALLVVGVTGTNGKTTTAHLLRGALESLGRGPCALLGTIAYEWPGVSRPAPNTTPGAAELQSLLAEARDAGCRAAVVEVSSHALHQRRTDCVRFAGAVYTNLSGDHLDYHGSMGDYAAAKARLFRDLGPGAVAAVNAEDDYAPTMLRDCRARALRYALDAPTEPDIAARHLELSADGVRFTLASGDQEARVESPLLGRYNALNLLGAGTLLVGLDTTVADAARAISSVPGVRGRLEPVERGQPFSVLVDYAHTDDAVANVLRNLRSLARGRLIVIVGCGGDRDRTKRPRMARAAAELSDLCWITSDNPRTEDPQRIIDDMLSGIYGARNVRVEPDRRAAIQCAVASAQVGDCVAVLGKGHEVYQILGTERVPFDDRVVAGDAIDELMRARVSHARTR